MTRQFLGQTQSHKRCFAVDDDAGSALGDQPGRRHSRAPQRIGAAGGSPIGEHHDQAAPRAVTRLLPHHDIPRGQQPLRQWRFPAGVES